MDTGKALRLVQAFCQCNSDCDGDCQPDMPDQSISPNAPEKVTRFVASMEWKDWATCQGFATIASDGLNPPLCNHKPHAVTRGVVLCATSSVARSPNACTGDSRGYLPVLRGWLSISCAASPAWCRLHLLWLWFWFPRFQHLGKSKQLFNFGMNLSVDC